MIRHAVVTGGTGVTGNALVKYLLQQEIKVTALIRPGSFRKHFLPLSHPNLTLIEVGMESYADIGHRLLGKQYDAFFHLAWDGSTGKQKVDNRNNFKLQNKNVSYALDAVELCRQIECPVFLMTGSQAEYGRKDIPVTEDMEKKPENGYGMAKLCAEGMTRSLCKKYGLRHVWPILFSVYGPCDATESLIDTSMRGLLEGKTLPYTKGEQLWDYLYSYDAARALLLLAEHGRDGESYHVAYGSVRPLHEYIDLMYQAVAPGLQPRLGELNYGSEQVMYLGADISKLKEETGFAPEYDFTRGVKLIWEELYESRILESYMKTDKQEKSKTVKK